MEVVWFRAPREHELLLLMGHQRAELVLLTLRLFVSCCAACVDWIGTAAYDD